MEKLELVVMKDNKPMLASAVNGLLSVCEEECQKANEQYDMIKDMMLDAMLDNNMKRAETEDFKVSIRENNSKWVFDEEAFKSGESKDVVEAFTVTEKSRALTLDLDALKEKYPNVYEECLKVEETETSHIDTNKLWKTLPNIYNKYATEIKPEKRGTISIKRKE